MVRTPLNNSQFGAKSLSFKTSVGRHPDLSNIDLMILRIDSSFHPILFITVKLTCVSTVKKTMMWKQTCVLKLNKKCVHNISSPLSREVSVVISLNFNACESAFLQLYHYFG